MIQIVNFSMFCNAFENLNRAWQLGDRAGLRALYDYIEEMEQDFGQQTELDVIGLCCEWSCYETAVEAAHLLLSSGPDYGEGEDAALAALEHETTVLSFDGGILVREF